MTTPQTPQQIASCVLELDEKVKSANGPDAYYFDRLRDNYYLTAAPELARAVIKAESDLAEMREENERLKAAPKASDGELLTWLQTKLEDAEKSLRAREQSAQTWASGTDESWAEAGNLHPSTAGKPVTKADRLKNSERESRIAAKCRHEVELFKATIAQLRDLRGKADGLAGQFDRIKAVIEAHEIDTLDCDRSGEIHCDCLTKELDKAAKLTAAYRAAQGVEGEGKNL